MPRAGEVRLVCAADAFSQRKSRILSPINLLFHPTTISASLMNTRPVINDPNMPSLIRKGLSYACGDGSSAVANLVIFTVLLRYLSPTEFGYLSVGQALSTWVQPVLYMGASFVAVRLIAATPQHTSIIAQRMIVLRFAAALIVSSCTIAIALHTSDRSLRAVLLAYSFLFLFYPVQPDFISIGTHRSRVYSISRWITSAVFISGVLILTRISIRAWMVPIAYATSLLASATYGYFALWPTLPVATERADSGFGALLRGAVVVVAAQFLQMGQSSIDTILLTTWKIPVALIGDYNAVGRLTTAGALPFVALIYSLAPMYVKHISNHDIEQINALERRFRACLLVVGVVGAIMIATIGPQVLEFIRGQRIPTGHQLAPIFAIGYLLVALHNSYTAILVYAGATYLYLITYALGLIGTLVSAIVLIPRFGTIGSAWAEVTGLAIILFVSYLFHRRLLRQQQKECNRSLAAVANF